ncbi:hypothetical protein [Vibrio cidicii]|uniref:hypothetical protein n=1 Tax=Vibrio cidicii TaxID=1763883 RepID=UPI0018C23678|nr:hypothetical protein [Vibrio cidicii]MBG0757091.1 hypothetical protein [Vibrio cidicii]
MTIIEVLVASLILFMAIGLSASIFRQTSLLQIKLAEELNRDEVLSLTIPMIRFELEEQKTQGVLDIKGEQLYWQSHIESDQGFVAGYDPDAQNPIEELGRVIVFRVDIRKAERTEPLLTFRELIWRE